ncbi:ester cyclase [uncultured Arthrobacter sp.]|uniref:ester cyclase n=1 Tax=uncultured Arthrobacter sp. TaxID=114050 RepID=UPI003216CCAB
MSAETNKALARRLTEEAFNAGNIDVLDELLATGIVNHDSAAPESTVGLDAARASIEGYRTAFPDLRVTIEDQIADDDRVVTRWSAKGTHQGELMGMPATGKQTTVTGITIDRIEDGRIAESWTNWDTLGMLQQLGVVPALATA